MDLNPEKIVEFDKWCKECEYYEKKETEDPCFDCLEDPVNEYSHRPTQFKEKPSRKN